MKTEGRLSFTKEGKNEHGKWWLYSIAGNRFFAREEQNYELNACLNQYCELELERGSNAWQYVGGVQPRALPTNEELIEKDLDSLRPAVHAMRRFSQDEELGLHGTELLDAAWRLKVRAEKKGV